MMDERIHAALREVLASEGFTEPTPVQRQAFESVVTGTHTLIVAPTGHGKTEAALIPVISRLLTERDRLLAAGKSWPTGFKLLYVTPLRALNRDLLDRLQHWVAAAGLRLGVRHGDTRQSERARQARDPPDILITTPETLQLLLFGDTLRRHLATVRFVVLDEVHDLAVSERGAQLVAALERVEEVIAQPAALRQAKAPERPGQARPSARPEGMFQRIGLSATVADSSAVTTWMVGRRPCEVVRVDARTATETLDLRVGLPTADTEDERQADERQAAALSILPAAMAQLRMIRSLVASHERVLVFCNTRDHAELIVHRSGLLDAEAGTEPLLGLHHGSLSPEHRLDVETRFKHGRLKGLVATSSLELGIDVGAIDHVVQVHSPRSIARMVQRVGRAGHRVGAHRGGTMVAADAEDALECIAVAEMAMAGELEPLAVRHDPLVVLANQVIALGIEYNGVAADWVREVLGRAGPFLDLDEDVFGAVWTALSETGTLKVERGRIQRSGRARRQFLDHVSMIPDERVYRVVDEASKRSIGTVDDAFVATALPVGSLFVMAGASWRVLSVDVEEGRVRVAPAREAGAIPQWGGQMMPVSRQLAARVASLRGRIAQGDRPGVAQGSALEAVREVLQRQQGAGLVVPTDGKLCIEAGRNQVTAHVPLGTRGNDALGRITQALLHQRLGLAVSLDSDAYRIHFRATAMELPRLVLETWQALPTDRDAIEETLAFILQESPAIRHHAVHVAKQFGALPKDLDPNRTSRARLESVLTQTAIQEEATSRLLWERMDVDAVAGFLQRLPTLEVVMQARGPLSDSRDTVRFVLPRSDDTLLRVVRERIETSDALMLCTNCRHQWQAQVHLLARRIRCRRCQSNQVACLRPWNEEASALLRAPDATPAEQTERRRLLRNAALVASFGDVACRALVARGVGPDTATRILQKSADAEDPAFWRAVLEAELDYARTSAYWGR